MVYCTPEASEDRGPRNAPNYMQYTQCTVLGNHRTPDKRKHGLMTSPQTHPVNIRQTFGAD